MTSGKEEFLREAANLRKKVDRLKRLLKRTEQTLDRLEAAIRAGEEPKSHDVIFDSMGNPIKVGSRVLNTMGRPYGTVSAIIPIDGDSDDEGRPVTIGPSVKVTFDNGMEGEFHPHWSAVGPEDMDAPFICEDLTIDVRR